MVKLTPEQANKTIKGFFLNLDVGFDAKSFREACSKKQINVMSVSLYSMCLVLEKSKSNNKEVEKYYSNRVISVAS